MRITAGTYRSRKLATLSGDATRPTQDKIKEAVFSSIGPYFDGGEALDLFGGSGSIALEALSRGMDHVCIADHSNDAIKIIKENVKILKLNEQCDIFKGDYQSALEKWQNHQFTFIYIDPPYALKVIDEIIAYIDEHDMLAPFGHLVIESSKEDCFTQNYQHFYKRKEKTYRVCRITYYTRGKEYENSNLSR